MTEGPSFSRERQSRSAATSSLRLTCWTTDLHLRTLTWDAKQLTSPDAEPPLQRLTSDPLEQEKLRAAHERALQGEVAAIQWQRGSTRFTGSVQPLHDSQEQIVGCTGLAIDANWLASQPPLARPHGQDSADSADTKDAPPHDTDQETSVESTLNFSQPVEPNTPWRPLVEATVDLILLVDLDGVIVDAERTTVGFTKDHLVGNSLLTRVAPEHRRNMKHRMRAVSQQGRVASCEVQFIDHSKRNRTWFSCRIGPLYDGDQRSGLIIVATDVTERRAAEMKLVAEEALLRRMLDLQDRERRLVSYEIHDGVLQDIIGAQLLAQSLREDLYGLGSEQVERLEKVLALLLKAINEGRRLISELRPMIIDEMGLVEAINYLINEEHASGGITVHFAHRIQRERFHPLLEGTLFRIVQEGVNNARRHAQTDSVEIRLTQVDNRFIVLEINDDGIGFDAGEIPPNRFGVEGIRERARLFGGGATIETSPGRGTRITVRLPVDLPVVTGPKPKQSGFRWTV